MDYGGVLMTRENNPVDIALAAAPPQQAEPVQEPSAFAKDWCLRMAQIEIDADAEFEIGSDLAPPSTPVQYNDEPTYCPTCGAEDGGTTCGMPNCGLRCGAEPVEKGNSPETYLAGLLRSCADAEPLNPHWTDEAKRLMRWAADALRAADVALDDYRRKLKQQAEPVEPVALWALSGDGYSSVFLEQAEPPERTVEEALAKGWRRFYSSPQQQAEPVALAHKDIIRMAREAGWPADVLHPHGPGVDTSGYLLVPALERFAALVAAAEREALAKDWEAKHGYDKHGVAAAIRARGNV
jgi:hypothetical protein